MRYLYGDATPFPLNENFIETICAATSACVTLFELDEELSGRRHAANELSRSTDDDLDRLNVLTRAIEAALRPMLPDGEPVDTPQAAAKEIAQNAVTTIKQARTSLLRRRDLTMEAAAANNYGARILAAVAPFFVHFQLPGTQWRIEWVDGEQGNEARVNLSAAGLRRVRARFDATLPEGSRWLGPIRICDLDPAVHLELQRMGGWLRRQPRDKSVSRFYITRVLVSPEHASLEIWQSRARTSLGYEVSMRAPEQSGPLIYPLDTGGQLGMPLSLAGHSEAALASLWGTIEAEMVAMLPTRNRLRSAWIGDTDVTTLEQPAELAECILAVLAPLVRELRIRSRVSGELVLKRELGDGRREELFMPRSELESKYAPLCIEHRSCFAAIGLGSEDTMDFVQRELPLHASPELDDDLPPVPDEQARARRIATAVDVA